MQKWYGICALLCTVGLLKEFRPSEPYVTKYLVNYKNFTRETVTQVAYPIGTYTYLGALPVIFLVTDCLKYKPVVILEGFAFTACYILLIWGEGLTTLKILEVLYGLASAAEVAYFTYIYAKVDKEHYQKVTSYIHTAIIVGNLLAAIIAQTLVSSGLADIRQLNFFTLVSVAAALGASFFLPKVQQSMYFHRDRRNSSSKANVTLDQSENQIVFIRRIKQSYHMLWNHCKLAYSNVYVLKWSIWWAIATAGNYQIRNYIQALWEEIAFVSKSEIYNGAVDATHSLLSTILAIAVGYVTIPWYKYGEPFLAVMSFLQGGMLLWMSQTNNLMIAYGTYIFFRVSFQVMITVASSEVAKGINRESYGLIFGMNRFMALLLQTILTVTVSDKRGLALNERSQFLVYGGYHTVLGIFFTVVFVIFLIRSCRDDKDIEMVQEDVKTMNNVELEALCDDNLRKQ